MSERLTIMRCDLASCRGGIDGCNGSECQNPKWDKVTPTWYEENVGSLIHWRVIATKGHRFTQCMWGCHTSATKARLIAESKIGHDYTICSSQQWPIQP